jgi:AraC-like DNA-binding protein
MLASYRDLARSLRLDHARLLRGVGLHRTNFSDSDALISAAAASELLEQSAEASGVEDFGLRLAATRTLAQVGPVGLLVREEPTVGHAIRAAERYFRVHSDALAFRLDEYDNAAVLRIEFLAGTRGGTRQATELIIGSVFRVISVLAGNTWAPESVSLSHPPPSTRTMHESFFHARTLFDSSFNGFFLRPADLAAPIRTADTAMAYQIRRYVEAIVPPAAVTIDATVRHFIHALLPTGRCTSETVAAALRLDRKTINRRLARRGETFSSVLNSVRVELARRHIRTERRSLTETAQLLGFSGLATFSRWFRAEFGMSATQWRASGPAIANRRQRKVQRVTRAA